MDEKESLSLEADDFVAHGRDMEKRRLLSNRLIELMNAGASDAEIKSNLEFLKKQLGFADGGEIRKGVGSLPEFGEASKQMADLEYEAEMRPYLHDALSQLGFDPKKVKVGTPKAEDHYSVTTGEVTLDPNYGLLSKETQAHEFRHRGLQRLYEEYFMLEPWRFKEKYGEDAYNLMVKMSKQQRPGKRGRVEESVQERIAEMFQRPEEINLGTVYNTSDARVFQTIADAQSYAEENPGVTFEAQEIRPRLDRTIETPRVNEFRDYMINKNRGETMQQGTDAEFEAVRNIQNAAADVLAGRYASGGEIRKGVGSLSEIARHMTKGGVAAASTEYRRSLYGTESSGGALDAVNKRTEALGASQAMPETLEEFKEETGRDFTRDQFKKNAGLQEAFQNWYEQKTLDYIANNGLDEYIGKMVKGVPVTLSGMMAVAHLGGNYGLKQFLETDGGYDPSDNKKKPEQGTRLSDYLQKHGGLNVYSDDSLSEDAKEELVMNQPVAPRNPIYSDPDYSNPMNYVRPVARPTDLAPVYQNELNESPRPVARPQQKAGLQEKYSPEGIEQLLIGTTAEPLLPRQFQQG